MKVRASIITVLFALALSVSAVGLLSGASPAGKPVPPRPHPGGHCVPVGGMLMTNFGAVDPNTTLGPATGDLRGAVSATLLGAPSAGPNGTVLFNVQHHWVTESGDNIFFEPATATTTPISKTLFAVITYPVTITGGTGKFAGATGAISNIGEADLVKGTVFRYSGEVCFAEGDRD